MEIVAQRDAATLLPIIRRHVASGSTVWSDEWSAYNRVSSHPNVNSHGVVNHSIEFINPTTGVHTQNVESYWNRVKFKMKRMRDCHENQLPSYLDEYRYRETFGNTATQLFNSIMNDIVTQYPVSCSRIYAPRQVGICAKQGLRNAN